MNYKYSKFNYFLPFEDSYVGMNLNDKVIFALEEPNYKLLIKHKQSPEKLKELNKNLFSAMTKLGIFVNSNINELSPVKINNRKAVYEKFYRITILPTLDCNYNCWYCYETHNTNRMSEKTKNAIIKHIRYMVEQERITGIELDWFGGEPLLGFDDCIFPISLEVKKIAHDNKIKFMHVMTTNGYLASDEFVKKFKIIELNNFQITLDGVQEAHNRVKKSKTNDSYQVTVANINRICEIIDNPEVLLRINYTSKNLKNITEIIDDFPLKNRNFIKVMFQQVWQLENKNKPVNLEPILNVFKDNGFKVEYNRTNRKPVACYADKYYQSVINYNGDVYKCTARDFNKKSRDGKLLTNGIISWDENNLLKRFNQSTFENKHCLKCKFLPVCIGPCSQKMIELENDADFKRICYKGGIKIGLERLFNEFYNNTFKN